MSSTDNTIVLFLLLATVFAAAKGSYYIDADAPIKRSATANFIALLLFAVALLLTLVSMSQWTIVDVVMAVILLVLCAVLVISNFVVQYLVMEDQMRQRLCSDDPL